MTTSSAARGLAASGACVWCSAALPDPVPASCPACGLTPRPAAAPARRSPARAGTRPRTAPASAAKAPARAAARTGLTRTDAAYQPICGIDPGARYTGVVVRDGDRLLHSSTLVRPDTVKDGPTWARHVVAAVRGILRDYPGIPVAVEGISDPKGFHKGEKAPINPRDVIRAAMVLGAVAQAWPAAHVVAPGGNGSKAADRYPAELVGRRPADLPGDGGGARTRGHEQSAWDVAGKAARAAYPPAPLDIR